MQKPPNKGIVHMKTVSWRDTVSHIMFQVYLKFVFEWTTL